jgi:regulator of sigma E protease
MWIAGFLLLLGPLVTVHELGHYLVGRLFGVKADAFSIGFGRELAGWTDRRGTRWKLSVLPLGGYVQFAGDMGPTSQPSPEWLALPEGERAQTFQAKPLWQRALIVVAGPLTNLLLAIVILAAFNYAYGRIVSFADVVGFDKSSPARAAGVEIGDRIVAVDGERLDSVPNLIEQVAPYPDREVRLSIERDGLEIVIPVRLKSTIEGDQFGNRTVIGDLGLLFDRPIVGGFVAGSPAQAAGISKGDLIEAVDGVGVSTFEDVSALVMPNTGKTVKLTVRRGDQRLVVPVKLVDLPRLGKDGRIVHGGALGIGNSLGEVVPVGPFEAITMAASQSLDIVRMMVTGVGQIITGHRSIKELGGPVRIAKFSGERLSLGWQSFVSFVALISINLAFINLLPIPALDGGHLAFYAAEAIRRKPVGPRSQEWAFRTGVALVLALMLFVTINDIASLPVFGN